jgi:hypothetical protein
MRYIDALCKQINLDERFHLRGPDMGLIKVHDELNPILWNEDEQLRPEVRSILMNIVNDFFSTIGVNWQKSRGVVQDILLIGSNCNYNYGPASDVDIHVITDFRALTKGNDPYVLNFVRKTLKQAQNEYKKMNLSYNGLPIEVVIEEFGVPNQNSAGTYSLLRNEWVRFPALPEKEQFNLKNPKLRRRVTAIYKRWRDMIDRAIDSNDIKTLAQTLQTILAQRREALTQDGDGAPENHAYKMLRKPGNNHVQRIFDAINGLKRQALLTPNVPQHVTETRSPKKKG